LNPLLDTSMKGIAGLPCAYRFDPDAPDIDIPDPDAPDIDIPDPDAPDIELADEPLDLELDRALD
jgi:hypothetical protein